MWLKPSAVPLEARPDAESAGAGKGRRTGMWDGSGSSPWKYDKYGRGGVDRRTVDGKTYETEYAYDALHRARKMTYPDDEALTYSYEASLLLDGNQSSTDSLNLVSSVSYKDIGLPDSYTLGSSPTTATQSFEYWKIDDTARSPYGAVKRTKLTKDSTDLVNREMQYDAVGNVTKIVDGVNSETIDYTYDDLDRLLTASVPAGDSYTYNTIGNMTSKSGTTLDYGTTSPKHGVKTYGSASYTYDANGSMTAKGDLSIKYDPEHRPVRVQDGSTIYRVAYDGDGVRRKRLDSNGTIHYLGHYERNVGNGSDTTEVVTKYYYATLGAMMRLIAFRRGGTLHWAGTDHLGGTIRVLDSSFAAVDGMRYEPYGEDRDSGDSLNTDRKFTGQTEDESIGLYWYQSRAYDPEIGRFVSPDVVVPEPGNPQALNRYSYVYNNPLKYVDPSGHSAEWDTPKWRKDFEEEHDREPTGLDIAYLYHSMQAASQDRDFSVEYWADKLERAASNVAHSVGHAVSNVADSVGRAATDAYNTASGVSNTVTTWAGFAETSYTVRDPRGRRFIVRQNVGGMARLKLTLLNATAAVTNANEILSRITLEYGSKLFLHEREHVEQMRDMGPLEYHNAYQRFRGRALAEAGGDKLEAWKIHPMEVNANQQAGLPDDWLYIIGSKDHLAP